MKKFIQQTVAVTVLALFSGSTAVAQNQGYIAISGGFNNPTGKFGSTDINDSKSGLAKQGGYFEVSAGKKITPVLGITAMFRFQSNPISTTEIQQALNAEIQYEIMAGNLPPGTHMSVAAAPWKTNLFMAGLYLDAPVNPKFGLTPRLLIGLMNANTPEITLTLSAPSYQTQKSTTSSDKASGLALGLGLGARLNLTDHVGVLLNFDYISAEPTFGSYSQSISMFTIGGGIGYLF